jgi:capsular exopolysaccharide synthesis family protein
MNRLAIPTKDIQRSQRVDFSATLEKMPLDELQKIVQKLKFDLDKAVRFVSEQERELASQRRRLASLEDKIDQASESEQLRLRLELVNEQEKKEMLEATLIGQRRNLQKREDIFNQHWQVLRSRQGTSENSEYAYARKYKFKPLIGQSEEQPKTEDLEELEATSQKQSNLRAYLRTFWRKAGLIAGITGVTTFIALLISAAESQVYSGNFYLLVEPISTAGKLTDPSTLTRTSGVPQEELFSLDYPTNLAFLQSPGMTSRIAEDVYKKELTGNFPAIWKDIRENLSVKRIGEGREATKIFEVTYEGTNSKEVLAVLQTAADTFLKYSAEDRQTNIKAGIEFIDKQLPDLQKRLEKFKSQQQQLRQQHELIDPIAKSQDVMAQISQIDEQLLANQSQLDSRRKLYTVLQRQLKLNPQEALAAASLSQDPSRLTLLNQLQEVESQIAAESSRFTSRSPQMQTLEERRRNIQNLLAQKTQTILTQNAFSARENSPILAYQDPTRLKLIDQLVDTANQIQVLEVNTQSLATAKGTLSTQARQLPKIANQYSALERQIALTNEVLDKLLMQRETLKVEAAQDLPWQLISKPQIPLNADGQPVGKAPGRLKVVAAGAMAGMLIGMVLAIWLERRRDVFYSNDDIQDILSLPVVGDIPYDKQFAPSNDLVLALDKSTKTEDDEENDEASADDSSFLAAFESLYAQLCFQHDGPPLNSIAVSSVEAEDGQSTMALYLAKTVARTGKRVLLVDANFVNPQLHEWLNLSNYGGLSHLLAEPIPSEKVIQSVPDTENLFVLTTGISHPDPSIRVWSSRMQNLMEELHSKYDLVIYDAPKFLDFTDTSFLAAQTNGIIMVVGVGKTSQSLLKKAVARINAFNLTSLGVIANHLNLK